jgi:hypothetical protein
MSYLSDGIEPIWRSDWYPGFNCEIREWIGRCDGEFYCAFEISPAQDEQPLDWYGPYATPTEAEAKLRDIFGAWTKRDGELWESWEDCQIAECE